MKSKNGDGVTSMRFALAFFFVFAVVPSFLAFMGWHFIRGQRIAGLKDSSVAEIQQNLLRLRRDADDRLYIQRRLNFLYGNLAEEDFKAPVIERSIASFREDGFGFINFRFFAPDASALSLKGQSETRRAMLQKIFEALIQPDTTGKNSLLLRYRPFFDAFIGGITPSEVAQEKSSLLRVMMNGKPGHFYWNTFHAPEPETRLNGGLLAYFSESAMPENMALEHLLASINDEARGHRVYGLIDLANPAKSLPTKIELRSRNFSHAGLAKKISVLRNNFEALDESEDLLLVTEFFTPDKALFCLELSPKGFYKDISTFLKILILVWLLIVARAAVGQKIVGESGEGMHAKPVCFGLSLRQFVVLFAAVVPVLVILVMGAQYRDAFSRMLSQETFARLSDRIESIDENYQVAVRNLESIYQRVSSLKVVRDLNVKGLEELSVDLGRKDAISRLHIVDRNGNTQFAWPAERSSSDLVKKIMPAISRRIFITQRGDEESLQDKVSDMMIDSFADSFADVLGDTGASLLRTFENLGRVNEFWLADRRHYVYTSFVERGNEKDPWLLYIWQGTVTFAQRYLQRQIQRNVDNQYLKDDPIRLAMVPRQRSQLPFPRDFNKYPFVGQMHEQIVSTEVQQYMVDSMGGESWLIAAAPLKRVPDYMLFAMYPYNLIEQKTFWLSAMIYLAAALCVASALVLARIIDRI
ncbi:MAG: hypothetical protein A2W80_13470 [Candidatus Riflebacteria bacterium GWC2_50_8]|nr:MAG: hypothetical protein A2W80_13470 [Candidatus Riflebacteria bacterium GWC2_50_8]